MAKQKERRAEAMKERAEWKRAVLKLDGYKCQHPQCSQWATDAHHIIYLSQGGKDVPENGIALCRECHNLVHRGGKLHGEWMAGRWHIMSLLVVHRVLNPEFRWAEAMAELERRYKW